MNCLRSASPRLFSNRLRSWLTGALSVAGLGVAYGQQYPNLRFTNPYAITTVAGQAGFNGYSDATGTNAQFNLPYGITLDSSGNMYVADENNAAIRLVTPAGVVTTFASGLAFGPLTGIGIDCGGNVYVSDWVTPDGGNGIVQKVTQGGVISTLVPSGTLNHPTGIAVDSAGNVYVADAGNNVIRKVTPSGTVSILAGTVGEPQRHRRAGDDRAIRLYRQHGD